MKHHKQHLLKIIAIVIFCYTFHHQLYAATADSRSDRAKVATSKSKKIRQQHKINRNISVAGSYNSDYNSKNYRLLLKGYYQDYQKNFQLDLFHYSNWQDIGSGKKKIFLAKTSELYDIQLIGKLRIADSKYYVAGYERVNYDDLSNYYYDHRQALGLGIFLDNDQIELDLSFGRYQAKDKKSNNFIVPSLRIQYRLSRKFALNSRNYIFLNNNSFDFQNRSSLKYYLTKNFALEATYNFDKTTNIIGKNKINRVERFLQLGTSLSF